MVQRLRNFVFRHRLLDSLIVLKMDQFEMHVCSKAFNLRSRYARMSFNISGSPSISGASLLNATSCKRGRLLQAYVLRFLLRARLLLHGRDEQQI